MKAIKVLGISLVALVAGGSAAFAKVTDQSKVGSTSAAVSPLPKEGTLADNVVVTPGTAAPAPAPAPTVNVEPVQPVQPAPVVLPPQRQVVTQESPHNYVATVFVSALLGGVAGALIGGSIYYLNTPRNHPANIGYWAAGGVLVGTGVGIVNVVVDESRAERAVSSLPADPVPTFRLSLLNRSF
ncbi:MAG TPA: hypothetical protein VKQ32_09425 [Polyangia bacterium]|nr:hypothetical protein [Polyangia bacterium]